MPQTKERVAVYVDGFNLYHGIHDLKCPHLKWVNLHKLFTLLLNKQQQRLVKIMYFSAFAKHYQNTPHEAKLRRHQAYVAALESKGITCQMANFAKRDMLYFSRNYRSKWKRREEKQTDVAIGVNAVADAFNDVYDKALILSCDTDMVPALTTLKANFPNKIFVVVAPPERSIHHTLRAKSDAFVTLKRSQIEKSLFGPRTIADGRVVARRPSAYAPP